MLPQHFLSESTVHALAEVVLHFLWQGALLGLAAACLLHVSPLRTAQARYAFFCGLLMLLALCPLVTWSGIRSAPAAVVDVSEASAGEPTGGASIADAGEVTAEASATNVVAVQPNAERSQPALPNRPRPDSRLRVAGSWLADQRSLIVTAWVAGVCLMAARLLAGAFGVCALARRSRPVPAEAAPLVERLSRQLKCRVPPAVRMAERISQAMAVGIFKPMVLLPAAWVSELPSDVLEAVIAHELAHLRRLDLPINLLQRVVETLLFFHPAVWWCSRRLRIEREMCCDELAQAALGNRLVYAKALAYLAHQQRASMEMLLATGIGGPKMVLLERIRNVLGMTPGRHGRMYGTSCALIGAALASLVWLTVIGLPAARQHRPADADHPRTGIADAAPDTSPAAATDVLVDGVERDTSPDDVTRILENLSREKLKFESYRDMSLEHAVQSALMNSKVIRSLGGRFVSSASDGELQLVPVLEGKSDVRPEDFETAVRDLRNETEQAYWALAFSWRSLDTANTALNTARRTWQEVHALPRAAAKGGEANAEAQAREQFYQFKQQAQTLLNELLKAENRLRYVMGLSPSDGQLIRPIDRPTLDKVDFNWEAICEEAIAHSPAVRRQRCRVEQRELELTAAKQRLQTRLEAAGTYQWRGLGDEKPGKKKLPSDTKAPPSPEGDNEVEKSGGEPPGEWQLGFDFNLPIGLRKELTQLRHMQLQLARERDKLQRDELELVGQLAGAIRQLELNYELTQTNLNRSLAADRQVEAQTVAYESGAAPLEELLEAQRRRAEAQASFFRTLYDYQRAILAVHYCKGSLL